MEGTQRKINEFKSLKIIRMSGRGLRERKKDFLYEEELGYEKQTKKTPVL